MSQQIYDAISLQKWSLFSRDVVFRPKSLLVKEKWFIWWYPHYPNPCPSFNRGHILPYHAWTEIEHSRELLFSWKFVSKILQVPFETSPKRQVLKGDALPAGWFGRHRTAAPWEEVQLVLSLWYSVLSTTIVLLLCCYCATLTQLTATNSPQQLILSNTPHNPATPLPLPSLLTPQQASPLTPTNTPPPCDKLATTPWWAYWFFSRTFAVVCNELIPNRSEKDKRRL